MKKTNPYQVTEWYRSVIRTQIKPGDLCIDATMGNGHDTLFLSQLAGPSGCVLAFDIQQAALDSTKALLQEHEHLAPVQLLLDSHAHMSSYADPGTVSCIVFNLGDLPSGDHSIATHKESTIGALEQGLELQEQACRRESARVLRPLRHLGRSGRPVPHPDQEPQLQG